MTNNSNTIKVIDTHTEKTLEFSLEKPYLDIAETRVKNRQLKDMQGITFDEGPSKDADILCGLEKRIRCDHPEYSDEIVRKILDTIAEIWLRNKGFFEPLRTTIGSTDLGNYKTIRHWMMLLLTYPLFKKLANVIDHEHGYTLTAEYIYAALNFKHSLEGIKNCLQTMVNLGCLKHLGDGRYIAKEISYPNSKAKKAATIYLQEASNAMAYYEVNNGWHCDPSEYRVTEGAEALGVFFPFKHLAKDFDYRDSRW